MTTAAGLSPEPPAAPLDAGVFRAVMRRVPTSVCVVTAMSGQTPAGMIVPELRAAPVVIHAFRHSVIRTGDHRLALGEVGDVSISSRERPMVFFEGAFARLDPWQLARCEHWQLAWLE